MTTPTVVEVTSLSAGYRGVAVVRDLDLHVAAGEVLALIGPNGAGKTTVLRTLCGDLPPISGRIAHAAAGPSSRIRRRTRASVAFVPDWKGVTMGLTVRQNLQIGTGGVEAAVKIFPELIDHLRRRAGALSGGQQQMLAVGRALAAAPQLLLIDELSLGLAPLVTARLLSAIRRAADGGTSVILVEQHVRRALDVADRAVVLARGRKVLAGSGQELKSQIGAIERAYLHARPDR